MWAKTWLLLFIFIAPLVSSQVYVDNCGIEGSEYGCVNATYYWTDELTGSVHSMSTYLIFRVYDENNKSIPFNGGYAVGNIYSDIYSDGGSIYYYTELNSWLDISCNVSGCNGQLLNGTGTYLLATAGQTMPWPMFLSYSNSLSYGVQSYVWAANGWLNDSKYMRPRVVSCWTDTDCDGGYCVKYPTYSDWADFACTEVSEVNEDISVLNVSEPISSAFGDNVATYYTADDVQSITFDGIGVFLASLVSYADLVIIWFVISIIVAILIWYKKL